MHGSCHFEDVVCVSWIFLKNGRYRLPTFPQPRCSLRLQYPSHIPYFSVNSWCENRVELWWKARSHFKLCRPHLNQTPRGDASENMWSAHPIWSKLAGVMHRRILEWTATITLSRTHSGRCGSFYWTLFFCLDYGYIEFIIDNVNPLGY